MEDDTSSKVTTPSDDVVEETLLVEGESASSATKIEEEIVEDKKSASNVKQPIKDKINIRLNAVGNAPILKQKLWAVSADREVGQIIEFVKNYLKLEKHQSLFLFVNQAFAPSPDQALRELYECFGSDGKIVFHYSTTYAWG